MLRQCSQRALLLYQQARLLQELQANTYSAAAWSLPCPGTSQISTLTPAAAPALPLLHHRSYATDEAAKRRLLAAQERRQRQADAASSLQRQRQRQVGAQEDSDDALPPMVADAVVPAQAAPKEVQVADVVGHPALIITRAIEWGTVVLGFEQATKYTVHDQDGNVVALMAEDRGGIGTEVARQVLRTRRSFTTTIFSADGSQIIFRVRRPAYLINSSMYIENPQGEVIGEVKQRWHLWRRNYDLYLNQRQFATISGNFLAWEFELKNETGETLALIDRNFQGFAKELFTDAGKYVVHFGFDAQRAAEIEQATLQARSGRDDVQVTPLAVARTDVAVIPTVTGNQLAVARPLGLDERMIALACAISIDYNFFSQHSNNSGLFSPPLFMPIPGFPGGGGAGADAGGAAAGTAAGGAVGAGGDAAAGTAAGAGGDAAAGAAASAGPGPASSEAGFGAGGAAEGGAGGGDSGWSQDLGGSQGFGDDAESFKWDEVGGGGGGGDGGGEDGVIASVLKWAWWMMGGGDD